MAILSLPLDIGEREMLTNRFTCMGRKHPSPNVKTFCKFEPQIWLELSHHVMPKVLVLKVRGRHVEKQCLAFFGQILAGKDHIT